MANHIFYKYYVAMHIRDIQRPKIDIYDGTGLSHVSVFQNFGFPTPSNRPMFVSQNQRHMKNITTLLTGLFLITSVLTSKAGAPVNPAASESGYKHFSSVSVYPNPASDFCAVDFQV